MVVAGFLPTMLVVAFVAWLAVMLTLASLEIELRREFDLGHELRVHAGVATITGALGGMIASASISRTALNWRSGGTAVAGLVSAGMALAMLLGASQVMGYMARASIGGLVLYLGIAMLRQWIWDVRRTARPVEVLQILLIVAITARHGFIAGFGAGVLFACVTFVVTYSRIPLTDIASHLGEMRSSGRALVGAGKGARGPRRESARLPSHRVRLLRVLPRRSRRCSWNAWSAPPRPWCSTSRA
jgi:MFS superfamily sulfate permease-like transporter